MRAFHRTVLTCIAAGVSLSASAATYYVAPTGSDSNPGTLSAPWKTMRKGLQSMRPGSQLLVRGGTYREILGGGTPIKIYAGTSSYPVTVKAYPGERPVVQGLLWLARPSYWTLDGINVTWLDGQSSRYHMVRLMNGVGWTFKNGEVWGAKAYAGILVASTMSNEPANWKITNSTIHDTIETNGSNQDHLIYVNSGMTAGTGLIEKCLLYNALNGAGIKLGGADNTMGTVNVTVRYNTVYNTVQNILVAWKSSRNSIYRNIFKKAESGYHNIRGYQLTGTGNVAYENIAHESKYMFYNDPGYAAIANTGGNYYPMDPKFDKLAIGGFHPLNTSAQAYGYCASSLSGGTAPAP